MFFRSKPAREKAKQEEVQVRLIADLDCLTDEPFGFRFGGILYRVKNLGIKDYDEIFRRSDLIRAIDQTEGAPWSDIIDAWFFLLDFCCYDVSRETVSKMNMKQLVAIFATIHDSITGRIGEGSSQKKTLKSLNVLTTSDSSLPH